MSASKPLRLLPGPIRYWASVLSLAVIGCSGANHLSRLSPAAGPSQSSASGACTYLTLPVHNGRKSKKTRILLFLFSLPSHPSAVPYDPRAIVWHPDARQTAQTSSRWLFTALQCPTTTSSHRALPWPTAPQNRPTQATAGAPDPAVTTQKARGPAGWAGGTRRPGRERQQHAQGQQSGPVAGPDLPRPRICMLK